MTKKSAMQQFDTILQTMDAIPDEQTASDHFRAIRWKNGAFCPHCMSTKVYHFSDNRTHKCGDCRKRFSIKVGTIFEDSKIPLGSWMLAIWLITSHKKGIASTQLAKDVGVTQKTAWFMTDRLRYAVKTQSFNRPLDGIVEADETFIGGKKKSKHANQRTGGMQGSKGGADHWTPHLQGFEGMTEKSSRNPPLALDMLFAEALERFIRTDRHEMPGAEFVDAADDNDGGRELLTWEKKLSTTDAQQQTTGGLVPYLRLTSGSLSGNAFQTWFRNTFFKSAHWAASTFNHKPVEEAHVPFEVTIQSVKLGTVNFKVTHDDTRQDSHNAPNTWLHWPDQLSNMLQSNNFAGMQVVLTHDDAGVFHLEI